MNAIYRIAFTTIQELFHEKVFYLLGAFALLAMFLSVLLGDLTFAEQGKITLDFLLAGTEFTTVLFSIFMGITLLNRELNLGWIAMVLSKPITRTQFLLGKFVGQLGIQALVVGFLGGIITLLCLVRGIPFVPGAIFQCLVLTFFEGMILSSLVYLCTVNLGALLSATVSLSLYALGNFSTNQQPDTFLSALKAVLPNFQIFNIKTLVSYGLLLDWGLMGLAVLYAFVCTVLYFFLASVTFSRRDIFT